MIRVNKETNYLPLVDKYRPKNIDKIILSEQLKIKIKKIIERRCCENTIIVGPPGVGKTLLIKYLAKEILKEYYDEACLNINTSSQRGLINIVTNLPQFCQKQNTKLQNEHIPKIVIMDEADNITKKAQNLIANMMEEYKTNIIFIFTCNDSTKLCGAIQSRCSTIYLPEISKNLIHERLVKICEGENISYTMEGLQLIVDNCDGDLRETINFLDIIRHGFKIINCTNVRKMLYKPDSFDIIKLIKNCGEKELFKCYDQLDDLKQKGFCGTDILLAMDRILKTVSIEESIRIGYIDIITIYFTKISEGLDSNLQLYSCISDMILLKTT